MALAERIALEAPPRLPPLHWFSADQARSHLEMVSRFDRFPRRNGILRRMSTPEKEVYRDKGTFVHTQRASESAAPMQRE